VYVSALIAAGGQGTRFGGGRPKQLLALGGQAILQRSVDAFLHSSSIDEVIVAVPPEVAAAPPSYLCAVSKRLVVVAGGARRRDSVARAFAHVAPAADVVVIHDAARPLVSDAVIRRTIDGAVEAGAAIAAVRAHDTVKRAAIDGTVVETIPREQIYLAQTPQAFRRAVLDEALALDGDATDEAALAERARHRVKLVEGDPVNLTITTPDDLAMAERLLGGTAAAPFRIGNGYDLHRLVDGRPLVLGGVAIPFDRGLQGHSDADAVCHAVTDAILGASGAGDIGRHFPDTDAAWKDANSIDLLRRAAAVVAAAQCAVVNVDVVVIAQRPKIAPYADAMAANLAAAIGIEPSQVSVKGKTNEGVDATGAGDAIAVHAVALVVRHHASRH
jgi:2-C-methyl-D-erythritol 4-phosphate cytidylyltransferase/2-C-methyl-D-erythritol 2,4-cyclodiphosphate synthase